MYAICFSMLGFCKFVTQYHKERGQIQVRNKNFFCYKNLSRCAEIPCQCPLKAKGTESWPKLYVYSLYLL
jgi:hypothetical protein